jgi:hypothetical protein
MSGEEGDLVGLLMTMKYAQAENNSSKKLHSYDRAGVLLLL